MHPTLSPSSRQHDGAPFFLSPSVRGIAAGLLAAMIWATFMVEAKSGTNRGLLPQDFILLRFGTAGAIMLPWLLRHDPANLAGIGWRRAGLLTLLAGPPFILLGTSGYLYAPLAHGAVIQPSTIALASMLVAAVLLKERVTGAKLAGIALIVTGLAVIASHSDTMDGGMVWIGDVMFVAAGLCWTAFTVLLRRWALDGLAVTAAVSVLAGLVVVPAFLLLGDAGRLAALPAAELAMQILVQGVLAGVVAVIAYGSAVRHLGAAKAGLFPAIVPAATLALGALVAGAMPSAFEWGGAGLATLGLVTAIGFARARLVAPDPLTSP